MDLTASFMAAPWRGFAWYASCSKVDLWLGLQCRAILCRHGQKPRGIRFRGPKKTASPLQSITDDTTQPMKTMTCKQLGGACEMKFHGNTFEEIAEQSKAHGVEMLQKGDKDHLEAMANLNKIMQSPETMTQWMEAKRKEFEELPDEELPQSDSF